jgi:nitric oxide dioxygenase
MTTYVKTTFQQIVPNADAFAAQFYERLFSLEPALRSMFKSDMDEQRRKLVQILAEVVNGLDRLEELRPVVENLGKRHVHYGFKNEHYALVAGALILTLQEFLGADFTPVVREAWLATYNQLAEIAISGASQEPDAEAIISNC